MSKKLKAFKSTLLSPLPKSSAKGFTYENVIFIDSRLPREKLWDIVSDTSRMNRAMGLPVWTERDQNGKRVISVKTAGQLQEWVEEPWMWTFPSEIQQKRSYIQGLMREQIGLFKLIPQPGGTQVAIYFAWKGSAFFRFFLAPLIQKFLEKKFRDFFAMADRASGNPSQIVIPNALASNTELIQKKYTELRQDIPKEIQTQELFRVFQHLLVADPMNIDRIKPKVLAENLRMDLDALLSVLVTLTRYGYLTLRWEVICPHCRGSEYQTEKLSALKMEQSCKACIADYALSGEDALEVVFKCSLKLRKVEDIMYCAAEPAKKKHIFINRTLFAGEPLSLKAHLPPNTYRARTLSQNFQSQFIVSTEEHAAKVLHLNDPLSNGLTVSPEFELFVEHPINDTLVIEDRSWSNDRLLAGEALSNIHLRPLLDKDLLQSGVKLDLGEQVILFTDIVSSTPFYRELGDGKAFMAVQKHYHLVTAIIERNRGVVVKFIGDAVMAAFTDTENALKACAQIHQRFNGTMTDTPMTLRASFHRGPVICANINVGLDYFGNTVNLAAKIQKWAQSREIAITEELWNKLSENTRSEYNLQSENLDEKLGAKVLVVKPKDLDFAV